MNPKFMVNPTKLGTEIPGKLIAFSHNRCCNETIRPDPFSFGLGEVEIQRFHCFGGTLLLATRIIDYQKDDRPVVYLLLAGASDGTDQVVLLTAMNPVCSQVIQLRSRSFPEWVRICVIVFRPVDPRFQA
ncbi:hypothetical protein [Peribacillus glennii]|uniref:hypothetical protein n=1 Tax=Peribacillus glennii TaxID=2303991 RepID=UPI001F259D64|nr:hypothetical protein [Peribacillus glennii]